MRPTCRAREIKIYPHSSNNFQHQAFLEGHLVRAFPTFYYATCPRLTAAISTLETTGLMGEMNDRLETDVELAGAYHAAHDDYIAARSALGIDVPEVENVSAGGMPNRVKCLHSLIAHSLSAGPDVNPLGDEALAKLPQWWEGNPCE